MDKGTASCCPLGLTSAPPFSSAELLSSDLQFHLELTGVRRTPGLEETVTRRYPEGGLENSLKFRLRIQRYIGIEQGE